MEGDTVKMWQEAVTTLGNHLLKGVNLTMSMDEFLGIKQGNKTFSTFLAELERLGSASYKCVGNIYREEVAIRDQVVRGTSDDKLRKDAQAKEHTLDELIMWGQS